ncbi:hypothetical protein Aasi_0512 [Candidatus Amoebophilus asiaticus 5a2]|uniref:Uncharacterized protein n=1 Tax=Amoebophilus asiaticus (strain 5a2) TaxID=452471 RepID=B3ERR4_AMOA5|nr:hypothetical protein [Candidatus Amoebophilus asiaticus]ACE05916.1 hypothetical protein Aasi_0512 [Candidatus Amoebophilus asiaticus 5a2]
MQNGQDFRQHVVKEIQNNATITQQFMTQAAQLSYLEPAAMMEGGWRWRVDMDTPNGVGAIVKVDDEGGADTQYYEYERTKRDAAGNPVLEFF